MKIHDNLGFFWLLVSYVTSLTLYVFFVVGMFTEQFQIGTSVTMSGAFSEIIYSIIMVIFFFAMGVWVITLLTALMSYKEN